MSTTDDPPRERGRRRSEHSHRAIVEATQALLVEEGYQALTIEGVATRAGVGKQTIYRWWPSRAALALEAYLAGSDDLRSPPESGSTADEVRALLGWLVAVLAQPIGGRVLAGLVADLTHDSDLADRFHATWCPRDGAPCSPHSSAVELAARFGMTPDLEVAVDALHGAVFYRLLLSGEPLDAGFIAQAAGQILVGLEPRR